MKNLDLQRTFQIVTYVQRLNIFEHKRGQGEDKGIGKISWKEKKRVWKKRRAPSLNHHTRLLSLLVLIPGLEKRFLCLLNFCKTLSPGQLLEGNARLMGTSFSGGHAPGAVWKCMVTFHSTQHWVEVRGDISLAPGGSVLWHFSNFPRRQTRYVEIHGDIVQLGASVLQTDTPISEA